MYYFVDTLAAIHLHIQFGRNSLHWASINGHKDTVQLLLTDSEVDLFASDYVSATTGPG